MSPRLLVCAASAALFLSALAQAEDKVTVYKTTGADGVNAYSQTEGEEARQVRSRDPNLPPPAEEKPKTQAEQACETAKKNLELIGSGQRLQRDKDGDGTPEDLTPEEIAAEKDLAQRTATAYCAEAE